MDNYLERTKGFLTFNAAQNCENHSKPECRRRHPISEVPGLKEETDLASDDAFPTSPV